MPVPPLPARSRAEPSPGCFQLIQSPGSTPDLQCSLLPPGAAPGLRWGGLSCAGSCLSRSAVTQQLLRPFPPTKFCCFPWSSCLPLSAGPRGAWRAVSPPGGFGSVGSPRDTDGLRREMRAGRALRWERLPGSGYRRREVCDPGWLQGLAGLQEELPAAWEMEFARC